MRRAGVIPDRSLADRFLDYLTAEAIPAQLRPVAEGDGVEVWIVDEDHVADGRRELAEFLSDPQAAAYREAAAEASRDREAELKARAEAAREHLRSDAEAKQPYWSRFPATSLIAVGCITVGLLTMLGEASPEIIRALKISNDPAVRSLPEVGAGELWRLASPALLHFGPAHFVFNLLFLFPIGRMVEQRRGSGTLLLLCLAFAVASNLTQYWWAGPNFGGLSGVLCGLFGYIIIKQILQPDLGLELPQQTIVVFLVYLVFAAIAIKNIANAAHFGGLAVGALVALAGSLAALMQNPATDET